MESSDILGRANWMKKNEQKDGSNKGVEGIFKDKAESKK